MENIEANEEKKARAFILATFNFIVAANKQASTSLTAIKKKLSLTSSPKDNIENARPKYVQYLNVHNNSKTQVTDLRDEYLNRS